MGVEKIAMEVSGNIEKIKEMMKNGPTVGYF